MSNRERRNHAYRYHAHRSPQEVAEDAIYAELERYAGELLTIESITVGVLSAQVSAFVRFDADTAFSITIHKAEWQLFTAAGYTLPSRATHEKGTYPFTAEITCEWRKTLYGREISLHVKTVQPKAEETMQPVLTPLQKQNAIETICRYDSRVTNVHSSFDVMLNPIVRIECSTANKAAVESAIAAYNDGSVAITWKLITVKRFTGKFDKTDKIPTLATIDSTPLKKVG